MIYTTPLANDNKSIRLLTIKASPIRSARIETSLRNADINGNTPYEALSYCWGTAPASVTIGLDGQTFQVRPTLAEALYSLRREKEGRVIWVDALCINQDDVEEKNFQVPLMPHIYSNCTRVVVWLGESDRDTRRAFTSIRKDSSQYPKTLTRVLRRPWFRRVWVIQEVARAPVAVVRCGDDEMDWQYFYQPIAQMPSARKVLYLSRAQGEPYVHPAYYLQVMQQARETIQSGHRFVILEALRIFRPFNATLHIDKVYGVIGLLEKPELIKVDYITSAADLYANIAMLEMRLTRSLNFLTDCTQQSTGSFLENLPSWAPDWSDVVAFQASAPEVEASRYQASQGTTIDDNSVAEDGMLQLSGVIIGTVEEVGQYPPSFDKLREEYWPYENLLPSMNALEILEIFTSYYRSGQDIARRVRGDSGNLKHDRYITNETLLQAFYNAIDVNAPLSDVREAKIADLRNHLLEVGIPQMERFSSSFLASLPWPLTIILLGPLFAISALIFLFRLPSSSRMLLAGAGQPRDTTQQDLFGRCAAVGRTSSGLLGLFPSPFLTSPDTLLTRPGDAVVLFKGAAIPYVIRSAGKNWRLVGAAYVYGIMYGGAFEEEKCESIHLV